MHGAVPEVLSIALKEEPASLHLIEPNPKLSFSTLSHCLVKNLKWAGWISPGGAGREGPEDETAEHIFAFKTIMDKEKMLFSSKNYFLTL